MFNKNKFCGKVRELGLTLDQVAAYLGINPSTLNRKMKGVSDFSRNEIEMLRRKLSLSNDELSNIFFAQ